LKRKADRQLPTHTRSFRCLRLHPKTGHCQQRLRPDAYVCLMPVDGEQLRNARC
jgi:hypothetical protein